MSNTFPRSGVNIGKQLTPQAVPVMAILKVFREMAGPRGRTYHHAVNPSTYEYEKHRFDPKAKV